MKLLFKSILISMTVIFLSGCIPPPEPTDNFTVKLSKNKSENIIYENALLNWSRPGSFWTGDAYVIERQKIGHNRTIIALKRQGLVAVSRRGDYARYSDSFVIIELIGLSDSQTQVNVSEGECGFGCYKNFSPDVRKWLESASQF